VPTDEDLAGLAAVHTANAGFWQAAADAVGQVRPGATALDCREHLQELGEALRVFSDDWNVPPPALDGFLVPYFRPSAVQVMTDERCPAAGRRYVVAPDDTGKYLRVYCPAHAGTILEAGPDGKVHEYETPR
jgi:hypothetical protein